MSIEIKNSEIIFLVRSYNESSRIREVLATIEQAGYHHIVIVDDGSTDGTRDVLQDYIHKWIHYIRHPINRGGGAALETGFEYIRRHRAKHNWKYVVTFDADGQMDIKDMKVFIEAFETDPSLDIVIWSRLLEWSVIEKMPWYRHMIVLVWGRIFTRLISGITPSDPHNWYRMMKSDILDKIHLTMDGFEYSSELIDAIAIGWFQWKDVPVHIVYDAYTLSKWQKASNAINIALKMIHKKFFM